MKREDIKMRCSVWIFLMLVYTVAALRCVIQDKKEEPEIHVIHLQDESRESSESDVVSLPIQEIQKREVWESTLKVACRTDDDCGPGQMCIAYLRCARAIKRGPEEKEENTTELQ